jgi:integrase
MAGYTVHDGIITRNPLKARSVQKPQAVKTEATPWTVAEVEAVADQLPGHLAALPYLGSACGMRQGELFGVTLGDLDFLRKIMHVDVQVKYVAGCLFFAPVKNRKTRDVPVADPVIPVLAEHVRQHPPVKVTLPWGAPGGKPVTRELMFTTSDGRALNRNAFNRVWRAAGVAPERVRQNGCHVLRHTAASAWLSAGLSLAQGRRLPWRHEGGCPCHLRALHARRRRPRPGDHECVLRRPGKTPTVPHVPLLCPAAATSKHLARSGCCPLSPG